MRFSEAPFLVVAAGLHGVLLLAALVAPAAAVEEAGAPIEVDVEVEVETTRPPEPQVETPAARVEPPPSTTAQPPARVEGRVPSGAIVDPGPVTSAAPSTEPVVTGPPSGPATSGTSEYSGPPPAVPSGGGIAGLPPGLGGNAWTMPGTLPDMGKPTPAPTTSPRATVDPQVATKVLKEAIAEKDKALGLDLPAAGTVASSVKAAVQQTDTPPESRATFEIRLSPTGQVLSVRVTSSSGGSSATWARAASAAQAALAGRTLAMTSSFAKGAVVHVNVQSLTTLPDGSKSAIERKGAGATFDLSNIGAHMQRVVRTSFSVVAVK